MKAIILIILIFCLNGCGSSTYYAARRGELSPAGQGAVIVRKSETIHPESGRGGLSSEPGEPGDKVQDVTLNLFSSFEVHEGPINALVVTAEGYVAFSGGYDGRVVKTELVLGDAQQFHRSSSLASAEFSVYRTARITTLLTSSRPILSLSLSSDETKLAVGQLSSVTVYDLRTGAVTNRLTKVAGRITALAWGPLGKILAIGRTDGDVFVWNLKDGLQAGKDSLKAVELYQRKVKDGRSSLVALIFHQSGRIFFAAERSGVINLWRLLRTENQMGLRDEKALVDQKRFGHYSKGLASVGRIEDVWLSPEEDMFFGLLSSQQVVWWKVRGLSLQGSETVANENVYGITGLLLSEAAPPAEVAPPAEDSTLSLARKPRILLAVSDRARRLKFWVFRGRNLEFLSQTKQFSYPLKILRSARDTALLWGAQKTGNLLCFDGNWLAVGARSGQRFRDR